MSVEDQVRQRIAMLRFLMIFGAVLLYFSLFFPLAELGKESLALAVLRCTVPLLGMMSGYLLLRAAVDKNLHDLAKNNSQAVFFSFFFFNPRARLLAAHGWPQWRARRSGAGRPARARGCRGSGCRTAGKLIHWLYKSGAHDSFSNRNLFLGKC